MPIYSPTGFLDITNATLRTSNIVTSNLHFRGSSNVFVTTHNEYEKTLEFTHPTTAFTTVGNVEVGGTITMGNIAVEALHSLEAVTAVGNTTPLTVEFTNTDTSLVASGNVEVSGNVTFPGNVDVTSNKTGVYGEVDSLTRIIGTPSSTQDVVSDDNGNYYVTSKVATDADILNADDTIHSSLTPGSNACAVIVSYNALGEVQWVNQVNTQSTVSTNRLALHGDALYVCGTFSGSATFIRNSDGTFINRSANTGPVCFIMRITASTGAIEGISLIESSSSDTIEGITIDANGQVYVAGTVSAAPVTFTDSEGNATNVSLTSSNDRSVFMVKYTSSLTPEWVVQVDDLATITTEVGMGVDVDSDGNLYLCGYGSGTPTIRDTNGLSTVQQTSSFSGYGTFVIKFNSAGVAQKISTLHSSGSDYTHDITVDSNDNVYVLYKLGKNTSTITDGDGITTSTVVAENSNTAAVVVKYDSELAAEWTAKVELESSGENVEPKRIVVDENGTVFITGGGSYSNAAYKAIDSSGSVFAVGTPTGPYSGFVVSFDTNGKYVWSSCIDGPGTEFIDGIFYSNRNVYVTGVTYATSGNLTITNGNGSVETVDITGASLFIIRYSLKDAYALRVNNNAIVTGDLEVGTANLFVDTVTGRVGIGTTSPSSRLHVGDGSNPPAGTVDADASLTLNGAGRKKVEQSKPGIYHRENVGLGLHSDYKMSFEVGGSSTLVEAMRIDSLGHIKYYEQPRFSAYSNNGNDTYSGFANPVILNQTYYNVGSHYSTSSGAFTAPVSGHYRFTIVMWNNTGSGVQGSLWYRTSSSGSWDDVAPYKLLGTSAAGDETVMTLAPGGSTHTFEVYVPYGYQIGFGGRGGTSVTVYRAHSYFSGELISVA